MSELSYKELQEKGIFDVPYRAFEYMQSQQAKIDELQNKLDYHIETNADLARLVLELQARVAELEETICTHLDERFLKGNKGE